MPSLAGRLMATYNHTIRNSQTAAQEHSADRPTYSSRKVAWAADKTCDHDPSASGSPQHVVEGSNLGHLTADSNSNSPIKQPPSLTTPPKSKPHPSPPQGSVGEESKAGTRRAKHLEDGRLATAVSLERGQDDVSDSWEQVRLRWTVGVASGIRDVVMSSVALA
eukprot:3022371-Rhodomonas_salina.11